jgi:hypothetical protein
MLDLLIRIQHIPHPKNHDSKKIRINNQGVAYASPKKLKFKKYRFLTRIRHVPHLQNHKFKKNCFVYKSEAYASAIKLKSSHVPYL